MIDSAGTGDTCLDLQDDAGFTWTRFYSNYQYGSLKLGDP